MKQRVSELGRLDGKAVQKCTYLAESEKNTPVNLTNHSYWDLESRGKTAVLDRALRLNCSRCVPVDGDRLIPNGEAVEVGGTAMVFTWRNPIGCDETARTSGNVTIGGFTAVDLSP